jgi:hypothetical protein
MAVSGVESQIPGTDGLCSCSPTVFSFQISYASTCDENTVVENGGISETSCFATAVADDPSDKVPVSLDTLIILELNDKVVVNSTTLEGVFNDGDTVKYASISTNQNLTASYFPFGLQVTLQGLNAAGNTVISTWGIEYTNDCSFVPVFEEDAQIGWTVFVSERQQNRLLFFFCTPLHSEICDVALYCSGLNRTPIATILSNKRHANDCANYGSYRGCSNDFSFHS